MPATHHLPHPEFVEERYCILAKIFNSLKEEFKNKAYLLQSFEIERDQTKARSFQDSSKYREPDRDGGFGD